MVNRRKKGLRGKVKKKEEQNNTLDQESKFEEKKQNIEDGVKFDDWEKYPGLKRECRVNIENLDVKQSLEHARKRSSDVLEEVEHDLPEEVAVPSKKSKKIVDKKNTQKITKEKSEFAAEDVKLSKKDNKEDQMFIDFELSKSKRISEIRVLLRSSGMTKQFCSLPPK